MHVVNAIVNCRLRSSSSFNAAMLIFRRDDLSHILSQWSR